MRWMHWDWPALLACPASYRAVIAEEQQREVKEHRDAELAAKRKHRGRR